MAQRTLTAANAVITLAIAGLFDQPRSLFGFAADDIFTTDPIQKTQTVMGVDGVLSGGYTPNPVVQTFALQADSNANDMFDAWASFQDIQKDAFTAVGVIILKSVGTKYNLTRGFLTSYPPIANAAKILQARRYGITWQSVLPAPV